MTYNIKVRFTSTRPFERENVLIVRYSFPAWRERHNTARYLPIGTCAGMKYIINASDCVDSIEPHSIIRLEYSVIRRDIITETTTA